ncbi:MAG: Smr/MutS family protein [Alphaproteobacteria bacterium]|nr:Smr/MutS family protein [Alphaproteobacteria bacterium]
MNNKIVKDEEVWEEFTKGIKKISRPKAPNLGLSKRRIKIRFASETVILPNVSRETLRNGDLKNLDASTGAKFRKGKMPIDGRIDLHGLTANQAFLALKAFLNRHYLQASRCVIVVTGKGSMRLDENGEVRKTGVIRELLPRWLNDKDIRPFVLSFTHAKDKDGGSGAFYVLLKRQRDK